MDADGQPFGLERLRQVLAADPDASADQAVSAVVNAVGAFTGDAPQSDDIAIFVVRRGPLLGN
jgi:serine phosphatase RsbU (regulator of sigma subunit)